MNTNLDSVEETRVRGVQVLLSRYVAQLVNGCGDPRCNEGYCHTGSVNISTRPTRRLTPRAARAIAFTICSEQPSESHLCPYYDGRTSVKPDAERDTSSIVQQLVDTPFIKRLYDPSNPAIEPQNEEFTELQSMHQQLRRLHAPCAHLPGNRFINNVALADMLTPCLEWLLSRAPLDREAPWLWVNTEIISRGNAYPSKSAHTPADENYNTWLVILDILDHKPYSRLLQSICNIVAKRCRLEDVLVRVNQRRLRQPTQHICGILASRVYSGASSPERAIALTIWLKKIFAQQWDAEPIVKDNTCYGILQLISSLRVRFAILTTSRPNLFAMRFITSHLSVSDLARSWVSSADRNATHLLHYRFLFYMDQHYLIFRTINHLAMSEAHRQTVQAKHVRKRVGDLRDRETNQQQVLTETNCLLINVSRRNVLKDTFDQLWHRRRGELRRPLRVRLGTFDELQVGQDLGGVQIEFFNLLCGEILNEQADMFTTEPKTGCSYLKAGSSQPLAYFRHFGVLLALAVYNGIALPITLPVIFYQFLIGDAPLECVGTAPINDGWPDIANSLRDLSDEDISGLDFTFDIHANGVHMSVHSPRRNYTEKDARPSCDSLTDFSVLRVVNHYPNKFPLEDIKWPGWTFEKSTVDAEEVTPENKHRYIREKVYWHTCVSVAPQLRAVLEGFHSADLFPPCTVKKLFTSQTLKLYIEGTDRLNIDELRAAASYTDYEAGDEYIKSFWTVVSGWPESKQKQLLKFVTAAERIPIFGPSQLVFTIKRADNPEHLPTSHTCFGMLDLPLYESTEELDRKLSLALKYGSEGFGMG